MHEEDFNKSMERLRHQINSQGLDDFAGYSPQDMHAVFYEPFGQNCPIQFNDLSKKELSQIPLLQEAKVLCDIFQREGKLKLTKLGFLPTKVVKELYERGPIADLHIEKGITKLYSEESCLHINLLHILFQIAKISRKTKGLSQLTKKGKQVMSNDNQFLLLLLQAMMVKFNWGYFDGYEDNKVAQVGSMFSFILLKKYGRENRDSSFYSDKYAKAFPFITERTPLDHFHRVYSLRTFERFLIFFGVVEVTNKKPYGELPMIKTNDLFHQWIKLRPHQELFQKN